MAAKNKSPGGCEQHSSVLSLEAGCVWDASPFGTHAGFQRGLGPKPSAGLPPYTEHPWGPLPAEPSEVVHSLGEGGDRRGSGRALRGPQEAMSPQPEAREVARTLGATAHAGRTESRACHGLRLGQLHRGGAGGPGVGRPTDAGHSWPGRGREPARGGREGREEEQRGRSERGEGSGEGGEGRRDTGTGYQPRKPLAEAATSTFLYIRKITAAAPPDATNGGAVKKRGGTEGGATMLEGAEAGPARPHPVPGFESGRGIKELTLALPPSQGSRSRASQIPILSMWFGATHPSSKEGLRRCKNSLE